MTKTYPVGYGATTVTMDELRGRHEPRMHPEFARRLFAWLDTQNGIGIGGGWRSTATQLRNWLRHPTVFARPGNSFHESHRWASGIVAYAAVDLVVFQEGSNHRAPTWAETESAKLFGLHTFIPNEPWHMQTIGTRSCSTWKASGRPDPVRFSLPTDLPLALEDDEMQFAKVDEEDTAILVVTTMTARWLPTPEEVEACREVCANDPTDPIILTPQQRKARFFLGRQPHYHEGSLAGSVRCRAEMWAQG